MTYWFSPLLACWISYPSRGAAASLAKNAAESLSSSGSESAAFCVLPKAARSEREVPALQEELTHLSSESTQRVVQGATDDSLVLNRSYAQQTSEEIVRVVESVRTHQSLTGGVYASWSIVAH